MARGNSALFIFVCFAACLVFASGCKRRPQDYAGLPDPKKGEIVDPHKSY